MHPAVTSAFALLLLAFGLTGAQNTQRKLPVKGAATSKPSPQPTSLGWTQWGGPNRNFTSDSKGLASSWPASGPRKLWSRALGDDGYSGIAVEGGRLYTMYRRAAKLWQIGKVDQEIVVALE